MKRVVLLVLGMFMMVSSTEATNGNNLANENYRFYAYTNAVNFIERGIEFYVFPNGEFDFYPLYFNGRHQGFLDIRRNFNGQIRSIENVRIRYDFFGNVTRIGDIFLRYRRGRLVSVGNLNVRYNRWGEPIFNGAVRNQFFVDNGVRFNLNIGVIYNYNDRFFSRNTFRRNYRQIREDRNFYYYRANPGVATNDTNRIIRRRKPNTSRPDATVSNGRRQNSVSNQRNYRYRRSTSNNSVRRSTTPERREATPTSRRSNESTNRKQEYRKSEKPSIKKRSQDRVKKSTTSRRNENSNRSRRN